MDLTKYWFRHGGSSIRLFTLPGLSSLGHAERLMAALLSRDARTGEILEIQNPDSINVFLELLIENELAGYVLESICSLGLETRLRGMNVTGLDSVSDMVTIISRQSALEAIKFEKFDNKFIDFLDLTSVLSDQIIWLKGIVTSRTCYGNPELRLSSDFDCFLDRKYLNQLDAILRANDFQVITGDTGFCNQLGVGPVGSLEDLFLVPDDQLVPSGVMGYFKKRCPILDIKFNPLDRGLTMIELDRFERDSIFVSWRGRQFKAPCLLDQLIVSLTHLEKDRFLGWKQLLDIKLLSEKINEKPEDWKEFVRRCKVEGVSTACCAGLSLAQDRVGLAGIENVIAETSVVMPSLSRRLFAFTVTPLFYWNTSTLPMLIVNAAVSDDSYRKINVLKNAVFPDKSFLSAYYCGGRQLNKIGWVLSLCLHWLVLLLPGGIIRRTFGSVVWRENQFGSQN